MTEYRPTLLFGGAITTSLPSTFADVSEIRQVPDNQEVYLDPHGTTSILFDILERVEKPDVEALHFHLEDIVDDDARVKVWGSGTVHLAKFPRGIQAYTLLATSPTAGNSSSSNAAQRSEADFVGILLTMVRLEEQKTDLLIVINVPHLEADGYKPSDVDLERGRYGPLLERAMEFRAKIWETLDVKDWGLFGEG